ncbi:M20 family metallopeptidase [Tessaracoccus caeni]|uniref:M20 family metallopeptidase n=1 Tax=Tessaracoccus caeni TaxID=3031239 RepID=UPI0023DB6B6F|nr:M20 family metallopeptidase [Tessaracoccus caeni]MDF1487236.1 M20 family metallopeptidase [Tessaracoccus caeni]
MTEQSNSERGLVAVKEQARIEIEGLREQILELNHAIHANPELSWEEYEAAALVAKTMREAGFEVTEKAYGLETAVEAVYGDGDFTVIICAEYDALPGVGHACGHNLICSAGVGAALGLAKVAEEAGLRVVLLGTPAEEHGGGKVSLLEAGAFEDAHISLMVHGMTASPDMTGDSHSAKGALFTAVERFQVIYTGRTSHAAAAPELGINASNAAVLALNAFAMLRQQMSKDSNMNAFISLGGEATNIIPQRTVVQVELRAYELDVWRDMKGKVLRCFEAGAIATGCDWTWEPTEHPYLPVKSDQILADLWDVNFAARGRTIDPVVRQGGGSTDMGNVSQVVPSIHPMVSIRGHAAPPHNPAFTAVAITPEADDTTIDGAVSMAATVIDVALTPEIRAEFQRRKAERPAGATQVTFEL